MNIVQRNLLLICLVCSCSSTRATIIGNVSIGGDPLTASFKSSADAVGAVPGRSLHLESFGDIYFNTGTALDENFVMRGYGYLDFKNPSCAGLGKEPGARFDIGSVGGLSSDPLHPFWKGVHFVGPYVWYSGAPAFPRLSIYQECDRYNDPTSINYVLETGNNEGHKLGLFLRSGSGGNIILDPGSGNVGIGTSNPTYRLSVNGGIRAREVIVESTGWADHVFSPEYKLASLAEVEQCIKIDGHLPDIPSASHVAANGVAVGEMQAKLLAKVEELTLYLIEQEKRLSAQNSRQMAQDLRLKALEFENAQLKSKSK